MSEDRIDCDKNGVDDVVINDVAMFRLERMRSGCFWIRCYGANGHDNVFWVNSSRQIKVTHDDEGIYPPHPKGERE